MRRDVLLNSVNQIRDPWRFMPHTFAAKLSGGRWVPFDYLVLLSHIITAAIAQGNGRILIEIPPRHGKSFFISQWVPAWFVGNWPDQHVMLSTYETNFAATWGRRTRNILKEHNSEIVKWHKMPAQTSQLISSDSAAASRWVTVFGGGMMTAGVGGPLTGSGFNLGLIDDPHKNWKEANSYITLKMIREWFDSTFYTRCEPNATIIVLHTRWNESDLIGYLKTEHKDNWLEIRLPAICEDEDDPMGRAIGEALCPERFSREKLDRIRAAVNRMVWAGLYQQRPSPLGGNIFRTECFQRYRRVPRDIGFKIQSWDTGYKKKEGLAFTVCETWVPGPGGYYLLENYRERLEYPQLRKQVQLRADIHHPNAILIEDKASGQSLIQDCQQSTSLPIIPIPAVEDKVVRAMAVSPLVEARRVHIPEGEDYDDFIERCGIFPNGKYSDEVDAMSQALMYLKVNSMLAKLITSLPRKSHSLLEHFL